MKNFYAECSSNSSQVKGLGGKRQILSTKIFAIVENFLLNCLAVFESRHNFASDFASMIIGLRGGEKHFKYSQSNI